LAKRAKRASAYRGGCGAHRAMASRVVMHPIIGSDRSGASGAVAPTVRTGPAAGSACTPAARRVSLYASAAAAPGLQAPAQGLHPAAQWLPAPRLPPGEASTTQRHGQRQALAGARRCARAGARCARRAPGATARLPARSAAAALAFRGPAGVQELLCTASMLPSSCHHSPAHILGVAYCRVETGE